MMMVLQDERLCSDIEEMRDSDATEIVSFLRGFPEVAFQSWQTAAALAEQVASESVIGFVVRHPENRQVVAALLGGILGTRAIVNHLAVDLGLRRHGAARALLTRFESSLKRRGIHRYFLFVSKDNEVALNFWGAQGLRDMAHCELTMERDIP